MRVVASAVLGSGELLGSSKPEERGPLSPPSFVQSQRGLFVTTTRPRRTLEGLVIDNAAGRLVFGRIAFDPPSIAGIKNESGAVRPSVRVFDTPAPAVSACAISSEAILVATASSVCVGKLAFAEEGTLPSSCELVPVLPSLPSTPVRMRLRWGPSTADKAVQSALIATHALIALERGQLYVIDLQHSDLLGSATDMATALRKHVTGIQLPVGESHLVSAEWATNHEPDSKPIAQPSSSSSSSSSEAATALTKEPTEASAPVVTAITHSGTLFVCPAHDLTASMACEVGKSGVLSHTHITPSIIVLGHADATLRILSLGPSLPSTPLAATSSGGALQAAQVLDYVRDTTGTTAADLAIVRSGVSVGSQRQRLLLVAAGFPGIAVWTLEVIHRPSSSSGTTSPTDQAPSSSSSSSSSSSLQSQIATVRAAHLQRFLRMAPPAVDPCGPAAAASLAYDIQLATVPGSAVLCAADSLGAVVVADLSASPDPHPYAQGGGHPLLVPAGSRPVGPDTVRHAAATAALATAAAPLASAINSAAAAASAAAAVVPPDAI